MPHPRKLTYSVAEAVREWAAFGTTVSAVARKLRISRSTVRRIIAGEVYKRG